MSIIKGSSITFLTQVVTFIAVMIWGAITARLLGPAGKGMLAVAIFYPLAFFSMGHLNINLINILYIGKKKFDLEEYAGNSLFFTIVISIILYVIFLVTLPFFGDTLYKGVSPQLLYLAFIIVLPALIIIYFGSILQGVLQFARFNLVNLTGYLLKIPLVILFVIWLDKGVMGALLAVVIGQAIGALIGLYYAKKTAPDKWTTNRELMRIQVSGGGKLFVNNVATFLYSYMEIVMVNFYLTPEDVGYIVIGIAAGRALFIFSKSISTVLYPEVSRKGITEAVRINSIVSRNAFMLILVFTALGIYFAKYIVLGYAGRAFLPAMVPMQIILLGAGLATFGQLLSPLWIRKEWFWQLSVLAVFMLATNLLLNIILIPKYGLMGAAYAKLLTYIVGFIQVNIIYFLYMDRRFWHALIIQRSDMELYKNAWRKYILRNE